MAKEGPDLSGSAKGVPVPNNTNFVWAWMEKGRAKRASNRRDFIRVGAILDRTKLKENGE